MSISEEFRFSMRNVAPIRRLLSSFFPSSFFLFLSIYFVLSFYIVGDRVCSRVEITNIRIRATATAATAVSSCPQWTCCWLSFFCFVHPFFFSSIQFNRSVCRLFDDETESVTSFTFSTLAVAVNRAGCFFCFIATRVYQWRILLLFKHQIFLKKKKKERKK